MTVQEIMDMDNETLIRHCHGGNSRENPEKVCHYIRFEIKDRKHPQVTELYVEKLVDDSYEGNYWDDWFDTDDLIDELYHKVALLEIGGGR